jgi:hypothetical protein
MTKTLKAEVAKILEGQCVDSKCEAEISCKECRSKTVSQILALLESVVPEEKDISYGHSIDIAKMNGFNACVKEIKGRMK